MDSTTSPHECHMSNCQTANDNTTVKCDMLCNTYDDDNNNGTIEATEVDNCPDIGTPERNRIANRIVKFGAPWVTPLPN